MYTKTEFRKLCMSCGYASTSKIVTEYIKQNPKKTYDDSDFQGVYRLSGTYTGIRKTTKRKG